MIFSLIISQPVVGLTLQNDIEQMRRVEIDRHNLGKDELKRKPEIFLQLI